MGHVLTLDRLTSSFLIFKIASSWNLNIFYQKIQSKFEKVKLLFEKRRDFIKAQCEFLSCQLKCQLNTSQSHLKTRGFIRLHD
jgi:hypothetical protein